MSLVRAPIHFRYPETGQAPSLHAFHALPHELLSGMR
jgi:hypothetical protein